MDKIQCLICLKYYIKPMTHCVVKHNILARDYKIKFGLDVRKGIIPEEHRKKLRENVFNNREVSIQNNLIRCGSKSRFITGHKIRYKRSEQTLTRLRASMRLVQGVSHPKIDKININCALCGESKLIYQRQYKENNNYCGVRCRNISINKKRYGQN